MLIKILSEIAIATTLASCGATFGVIGVERRPNGDAELEIVGPYQPASETCPSTRGDDPETHAALDERCRTATHY